MGASTRRPPRKPGSKPTVTKSSSGIQSAMTPMTRADLHVVPKTVLQQTIEKLRTAIMEGLFQPGERLIESEVTSMLGVSRPSLREALRSLEGERLIKIVPNRGPHVTILTWEEAEQIYQVRMMLEGEAAALSAARAGKHELEQMRRALEEFEVASTKTDRRGRVATTTTFYSVMLESCGNHIIEDIITGLLARINFLRDRSMSQPRRPIESHREMIAIYRAIVRRDPEAARRAAVRHVECASLAAQASYELAKKQEKAG